MQVAVIGTGFIGPVHVEALRRLGIEVAGILGSSPSRSQSSAESLSIGRAYASIEELANDSKIDVVHIASPNNLHFEHAKALLAAGKHVVCEKPLAMSSQETAELVAAATSANRLGALNFNIRYYPLVHEARARVRSGEMGSLYAIHGHYLQDWLLFPTDWNWRLQPEFAGPMRAVADIGSHWLDLATFVTGRKVESVMAELTTFLPTRQMPKGSVQTFSGNQSQPVETQETPITTEDFATILLRYEGGMRGSLTVSQVSAGRKNSVAFELDCESDSLSWNSERANELWIGHRNRPNEILVKDPSLLANDARGVSSYPGGHDEGFADTFKQLYSKIYGYLKVGDLSAPRDFPTFEDGHYEQLLADAILQSARQEQWVKVEAV